jgi:protein-disulfide isomerase
LFWQSIFVTLERVNKEFLEVDKKAWIIFSVVVVIVLGGLVYLSSKNKIDVSSVQDAKPVAASEQNGNIADHVFGLPTSKAILVEYGDFQCPGCGGAYPQLKKLSEDYKDKITFVFRNFPLTSIHPNARAAAAAAEAAGFQGKYWEMHDILYENQKGWENATAEERDALFAQYATTVGVNKDRFTNDLSNSNISKKISFDQALGKKAKVNSTPTLFLNGVLVEGTVTNNVIQSDGSELKKLIDEALK